MMTTDKTLAANIRRYLRDGLHGKPLDVAAYKKKWYEAGRRFKK